MEELIHLFEERTGEVEITAVVECIPLAAVPVLMVTDRVGRIGWKDREHVAPAQIAFAHVERPFHSPCQPPLQSALGAERWLRHLHFCIEGLISIIDRE